MEAELGRIDFELSPMVGVVENDHKLIATPSPELYDLAQDAAELDNLSTQLSERAQELGRWIANQKTSQRSDATHQAGAAAIELLRGLGYTGGASPTELARTEWTSAQLARWSELSNTGMRHYQARNLAEAISALRPLVQECSGAFSAQLWLGLGLVNSGETGEGLRHLELAVALQPNGSADAWWNIAVGKARTGEFPKTEQALLRVIAIEPAHLSALQKLAELRLQATDRKQATHYLERLLQHAPESPEGRWTTTQLRRLKRAPPADRSHRSAEFARYRSRE
jgi:tetratricopeptide (TPR) repeat protein